MVLVGSSVIIPDLLGGGYWHIVTSPSSVIIRGFTWSGEAYLSYSLSALSLCGFIAAVYSWYNNTAYPSEFYGPTAAEASQAQGFTLLVRELKLLVVKVQELENLQQIDFYFSF